jgi:hypothetical protein
VFEDILITIFLILVILPALAEPLEEILHEYVILVLALELRLLPLRALLT